MNNEDNQPPEFWEAAFQGRGEMWGFEPTASAKIAGEIFSEDGVRSVLIPGIGYGRNASVFRDRGMEVTGIEISQTAIDLARKHFGPDLLIHHGSVSAMPFDDRHYDGIFCHGLIYLLDRPERGKLIHDCLHQLAPGGCMIFTVISKAASTYGQGTLLSEDRYEQFGGVQIFFYDRASIASEFGEAGLIEVREVEENFPFYLIVCRNAISGDR